MGLINLLSSSTISLVSLYWWLIKLCGYIKTFQNKAKLMQIEFRHKHWFDKKVYKHAPGPYAWPVVGNLFLFSYYDSPFKGFSDMAKQFGNLYRLTLGTRQCLVVSGLELICEVLNKKGKYFGGRPDFIRFNVLFGGNRNNSLALCDWSQLQQKRRKLARKHFSPRTGSTFYQSMADVSSFEVKEFLFRLSEQVGENSGDIHLKPLIQQACANMFCNYMCSSRFDYDDGEFKKIVRCFDEIFWEINQGHIIDFLPWLSPFYLGHIKKIVKWSETIRYFILNRIIAEKETNMQTTHLDDDFTYDLLKSLADNDGITRNNIIYMLEDFIGGHSAIGNLVMLALAYIAKHPHVGTRIQNEIDRVLDDCPRIITQNDASAMPYTMCTIYEVLRSCSSPIVPHVATADVVIGDYDVAKGTIVFINNYDLNTNPKYWKNPTDFDPSRFLVEDTSTNPSQSESETKRLKSYIPHFLPFSIGRRTCIGQSLVKGFSFTLIANILNAYNVSTNDLSKIKIYPACLALPPDTFSIKLIPRSLYQ